MSTLRTTLSAIIEGYQGDVLKLNHIFSTSGTYTQYLSPIDLALGPLVTQNINLPTVLSTQFTCKLLFIESSLPVDIGFTTPTGPNLPPDPQPATVHITSFIVLDSSLTDLWIYNPNNATVSLKITAVGA